jgi:hypothetical protein
LLACIIEEIGLQSRYDSKDDSLHHKMLDLGFLSYQYDPRTRHLQDLGRRVNPALKNTLYIRDLNKVKERLNTAKKFAVRGLLI